MHVRAGDDLLTPPLQAATPPGSIGPFVQQARRLERLDHQPRHADPRPIGPALQRRVLLGRQVDVQALTLPAAEPTRPWVPLPGLDRDVLKALQAELVAALGR